MLTNNHQNAILVKAQAKIYPNQIKFFIPANPFIRRPISGNKTYSTNIEKSESSNCSPNEAPIERSLRRTRQTISDYILCNNFKIFATFTFAKDRENIDEKRRQMSDWLKNQQKRHGKFQYLAIPEFHADKRSLHFHVLLTNFTGRIQRSISLKSGKPIMQRGRPVYEIPSFTLGFTNVKFIGDSDDDVTKVAHYVQKYITKDLTTFRNKRRYFGSQDLKKPKIIDNPGNWFAKIKPNWQKKTENGLIMIFKRGVDPKIDNMLGEQP